MKFSRNGTAIDFSEEIYLKDPDYPQKAVYTSLRTYHGKPFALEQHLERLRDSANRLGFRIPHSIDEVRKWIGDIIALSDFEPQFLRITATPQNIFILSRSLEIDQSVYQGVRVSVEPVVRENVKVKAVDTPDTIEAYDHAQHEGFYEALLLNEEKDMITEGSRSNILWIKEGTLYWCNDALSGITQATVLKLAERAGISTRQSTLPLEELADIDEFFLTQTSRGIVPIVAVNSIAIKDGKVGPMTRQLMKAFEEFTRNI